MSLYNLSISKIKLFYIKGSIFNPLSKTIKAKITKICLDALALLY